MKTFLYSVLLILISQILIAQEPGDILWSSEYGGNKNDALNDIAQTLDGGYVAVGYTDTYSHTPGIKGLWIVKLDAAGDTLWTKVIGEGVGYGEFATAVVVTEEGDFVIVGETYSYAANEKDAWILKLDKSGNKLWEEFIDGSSYDSASDVIINNEGNYVMTGYTFDASGNRDVFLVIFSPDGEILVYNAFDGGAGEWATGICQTLDNGYVLSGYTESYGAIGRDLYLIKTDAEGEEVWNKVYGGVDDQWARSVAETADGNLVAIGWEGIFLNGSDIWLLKMDAEGDTLWTQTYDFGSFDTANGILVTNDGGYLISGMGDDRWLAMKTSADGTVEWMDNEGQGVAVNAIQNSEGNYLMAGGRTVGFFNAEASISSYKGKSGTGVNPLVSENGQNMKLHNYPNPFTDLTSIQFYLNAPETVCIEILNMKGEKLSELGNNYFPGGWHKLEWNGTEAGGALVPNGLYYIRIVTSDNVELSKILKVQ